MVIASYTTRGPCLSCRRFVSRFLVLQTPLCHPQHPPNKIPSTWSTAFSLLPKGNKLPLVGGALQRRSTIGYPQTQHTTSRYSPKARPNHRIRSLRPNEANYSCVLQTTPPSTPSPLCFTTPSPPTNTPNTLNDDTRFTPNNKYLERGVHFVPGGLPGVLVQAVCRRAAELMAPGAHEPGGLAAPKKLRRAQAGLPLADREYDPLRPVPGDLPSVAKAKGGRCPHAVQGGYVRCKGAS